MQTGETQINPAQITAFIPAAGFGTRLGNLTQQRPKALAEINGKPLIKHVIDKLTGLGITKFIVNVHHFAGMITNYLQNKEFADLEITISDESCRLMDTGGGIIKASKLIGNECRCLIVHNVDILTDINLSEAIAQHYSNNNDVTLLISDRNTARKLVFDQKMALRGWKNLIKGEQLPISADLSDCEHLYAFTGVHLLNPELTGKLPDEIIPLTKLYLSLTATNRIEGYLCRPSFWFDLGKPDDIIAAQHFLNSSEYIYD
jgi:NDP-sugar pyrophosphorylase family protein